MTRGCKFWNDRSWYNVQNNNTIEKIVRLAKIEATASEYKGSGTESCAVEALLNGCRAMGMDVDSKWPGFQAADIGMLWLNDYQNAPLINKYVYGNIPENVMVNRYQETGKVLLKELFNISSEFHVGIDFDFVKHQVIRGKAVQLLQEIGHYVCAIAYSSKTDSIIYTDSWKRGAQDRFNVYMNRELFTINHGSQYRSNCVVIKG